MDLDALEHEPYMERALELAREAGTRGDEPFGSLLVRDETIIMEERNAINTARDVARHPELTLARRAERQLSPAERAETVMYTSTEPCAMCSGGMYLAGLAGVVYSVSAERAAELTDGDWVVPSTEIFDRGARDIEVRGPVLPEAGARVHEECWPY